MTEDALTPAEEERVRRLLAEARHTDPMPADVADRFDAVIGELAAERDDEASSDVPAAAAATTPSTVTASTHASTRIAVKSASGLSSCEHGSSEPQSGQRGSSRTCAARGPVVSAPITSAPRPRPSRAALHVPSLASLWQRATTRPRPRRR